jgi:hypothetical protein
MLRNREAGRGTHRIGLVRDIEALRANEAIGVFNHDLCSAPLTIATNGAPFSATAA